MAKERSDAVLDVKNISVAFDGFKAIDGLSLSVAEKELRVIIGPNGAGKTTLLDIICGKTKPDDGMVFYRGIDLTKLEEFRITRLGLARKFQTPSIYENLSVFENFVLSIPKGRGVAGSLFFRTDAGVRELVVQAAERVFLGAALNKKAAVLSHGQKQWLEIGMMLVQQPTLVLLDEPVAGMSSKERDATATLLASVAEEAAVVVIEHDMDFVRKIARRITVMHQGKVLCEGSVEEVQRDPRVIEVYLGE